MRFANNFRIKLQSSVLNFVSRNRNTIIVEGYGGYIRYIYFQIFYDGAMINRSGLNNACDGNLSAAARNISENNSDDGGAEL